MLAHVELDSDDAHVALRRRVDVLYPRDLADHALQGLHGEVRDLPRGGARILHHDVDHGHGYLGVLLTWRHDQAEQAHQEHGDEEQRRKGGPDEETCRPSGDSESLFRVLGFAILRCAQGLVFVHKLIHQGGWTRGHGWARRHAGDAAFRSDQRPSSSCCCCADQPAAIPGGGSARMRSPGRNPLSTVINPPGTGSPTRMSRSSALPCSSRT